MLQSKLRLQQQNLMAIKQTSAFMEQLAEVTILLKKLYGANHLQTHSDSQVPVASTSVLQAVLRPTKEGIVQKSSLSPSTRKKGSPAPYKMLSDNGRRMSSENLSDLPKRPKLEIEIPRMTRKSAMSSNQNEANPAQIPRTSVSDRAELRLQRPENLLVANDVYSPKHKKKFAPNMPLDRNRRQDLSPTVGESLKTPNASSSPSGAGSLFAASPVKLGTIAENQIGITSKSLPGRLASAQRFSMSETLFVVRNSTSRSSPQPNGENLVTRTDEEQELLASRQAEWLHWAKFSIAEQATSQHSLEEMQTIGSGKGVWPGGAAAPLTPRCEMPLYPAARRMGPW